jgi:hypothetical protein
MKRLFFSLLGICLLSAAAAYVTYLVVGPPDRSVECDQGSLPEHHVCLSTVREWPDGDILWIDARPKEDWESNGVEGSILINEKVDPEDWGWELLSRMNESPRSKVVVYCNKTGCGSSKYVADLVRKDHAQDGSFEVFVLEGGFKALSSEKE